MKRIALYHNQCYILFFNKLDVGVIIVHKVY